MGSTGKILTTLDIQDSAITSSYQDVVVNASYSGEDEVPISGLSIPFTLEVTSDVVVIASGSLRFTAGDAEDYVTMYVVVNGNFVGLPVDVSNLGTDQEIPVTMAAIELSYYTGAHTAQVHWGVISDSGVSSPSVTIRYMTLSVCVLKR